MKIRIIYNHDIFTSVGRASKGDVVDVPDSEARLYFDRDWAMPSNDVEDEIQESEEDEDSDEE